MSMPEKAHIHKTSANHQLNLIKLGWKASAMSFIALALTFGGLFLVLKPSQAADNPVLALIYLGSDPAVGTWNNDVHLVAGQKVTLYSEVHNTSIGSTAKNVRIMATLPTQGGLSNANINAEGANSVFGNVNISIPTGSQLRYIPGSTKMTWDTNGDGNFEFKETTLTDGVTVGNGIVLGDLKGGNSSTIKLTFMAEVVAETPSPSPTPVDVITSQENNNDNHQKQEQTQNNNQTVNITANGTVAGATTAVPTSSPKTGVGVLGIAGMFSAAPVGVLLSRFGKGRALNRKRDNEMSIASGLVEKRRGSGHNA